MDAARRGEDTGRDRRLLDKLFRDGAAGWAAERDAPRLLSAMLAYDDPVELVFRLTNPREHGAKRLRDALLHDGSPPGMARNVVPLLRMLSGDVLAGGTCRVPLLQVLEVVYRVPGLLGCLRAALAAGAVADAAPVGWFLLTLAAESEDVRRNSEVATIAQLLATSGGDGAKVAARLQVVLGGDQAAAKAAAAAAAGTGGGCGPVLEDLLAGPGGRHDNDHADYRSIHVMPTSEEALCARQPYLPHAAGGASAVGSQHGAHGVAGGSSSHAQQLSQAEAEAALLDRQFRLLREDFAQPLREALAVVGFHAPQAQAQQEQLLQQKQRTSISAAAAARNVFPLVEVLGVWDQRPRACVLVAVQLPMSHRAARMKTRKEREQYWSEFGKGTLPADALVCVARRPLPGQPLQPLLFGIIARREPKEMAREKPVLGLAFERGQAGVERLLAELGRGPCLADEGLVLVQVSTGFFAVRPVLRALQAMAGVPLAEEVALGTRPQPLAYLPYNAVEQELEHLGQQGLVLDPSQRDALLQALSQRVALVQGPPGTGKTFVGALLCDALVRRSSERILVVCYTNHALDQFLESLIEKGITDVVRVGGRSKNPALTKYTLRELCGPNNKNRPRMSQAAYRRLQALQIEVQEMTQKVANYKDKLLATAEPSTPPSEPPPQAPPARRPPGAAQQQQDPQDAQQQGQAQQPASIDLWGEMELHLDEHHPDMYDSFSEDNSGHTVGWCAWLTGEASISAYRQQQRQRQQQGGGGWQQAKSNAPRVGYKRAASFVYRAVGQGAPAAPGQAARGPGGSSSGGAGGGSAAGASGSNRSTSARSAKVKGAGAAAGGGAAAAAPPPLPVSDTPAAKDLWQLPFQQRVQLAATWRRELRARWGEELAALLTRINELQAEIRTLHNDMERAVLAGARVIGATTTGAAMYKDLLRDPDIDPGVVLVEEAGELLEAHVLTSLSPRTKHLIMIGDHKQLRPKVECWSLQVQSGAGFDLNVSLFERLVLSGFPHTTLAVQHRMHPDISQLVRPTYPALLDAPRVLQHPPLRGLPPGRRVVFVDHSEPEQGEKEKGLWNAAAAGHQSKVNLHEVGMVREAVRYLLRQGYAPGQLVVLTPYLGQLLELQRELSRDMQVLLDELDLRDLRAAALPGALGDLPGSAAPAAANGGGGGKGVRVATVDNYQGEEADVVVASLVRCNAAGSVGFVGEPERINVLLSRARHGMLLFGSTHTLRNARGHGARHHWGRVLDSLQASGAIQPGFPATCQRHGTTAVLAAPADFAARCPDGGCQRPCHAKLPCGHTCMLRCHAYDTEHTRVVCVEEVMDVCDRGHPMSRRCSTPRADAVCAVCVEVRKIESEERLELAKLEAEAARKRREAAVEATRLQARVERLRQQQAALEEQRLAKQGAVEKELEAKLLRAQVELQEKYGKREMDEWEAQQRAQAEQQLQELEARAQAEAELHAEEVRLRAEEEDRRRMAEAAQKDLRAAHAKEQAGLQAIANQQRRAAVQADEKRGAAEAAAGGRIRTMAAWKEELAAAAKQGVAGVAELRQTLAQAASGSPDAAADLARTLGAVFGDPGAGECVVRYAAQPEGEQEAGPEALGGSRIKRGIALIGEGKWIDALKFFNALAEAPPPPPPSQEQQQPPTNGGDSSGAAAVAAAPAAGSAAPSPHDPAVDAFTALCRSKLGLPPPQQATKVLTPGRGGRGGGGTAAAGRASAAAAANTQQQRGDLRPHAAEHLAAALAAAQARTGGASGTSPAAQRAADAKAAGAALAFLLHPDTPRLPSTLRDEALRVLQDTAPALLGPALPIAAGGGGSGASAAGGSTGRSALPAAWEERSKRSPSLAKLLQLTGLDPVKRAMFELAAAVELDKERRRPLGAKQYNVRFHGNPGTGKTTVARLYAGLLKELGVLPGAQVEETSGSELLTGGVSKLKEALGKLDKGGVLFLDEAYQLNPKTNPMGAQVLDYLLPEMENRRGKLVVVLAGYKKQMEDLMAHNEGLPSRFAQEFTFPDYSDEELLTIFRDLIAADAEPRFRVADDRHLRIAARRLGQQRGATGFGNARAVRNAYEAAQRRQSARVLSERAASGAPDPLLLVREDLLGPRYLDESNCEALRELRGMRGLAAVKEQVDNLLSLIRTNAELEDQERPLKRVNLNRILLGNPGTGKTTVAGLYGRILRDLGLLSKGDVEVRVPADFVGDVLGASEKKTDAILEATKGCVLVIDEAYGLYAGEGARDPFREAVVDTIVARVQGVPGDDRCVLLAGYEEEMESFIRKANPGLARRFQMSEAWRFEDYSAEDLLAITQSAAAKRGWQLDEPSLLAAVEALDAKRRKPNFGNAGEVNNLLSAAAQRMEARLRHLPPAQRAAAAPAPEDFLPPKQGGDPSSIFADLVGCGAVLDKLREWQATILACQAVGRDPLQSFELNFRFVGAPGTGKTTVARRVGQLFASLGLLAGSEMVSCSASDFVTGYANQASGKTREMFKKAVGGVLFIDEAYRLNPKVGGPFMQEVLDEIVQLLTEPAFMGKMVVILAGYDNEIEELMRVNPGLKSRFSQRLHFPNFTPADAAALLQQQLGKEYGLALDAAAAAALEGLAAELVAAPNWANGRDVGTWAKRAFAAYAKRSFAPGGSSTGSGAGSSGSGSDVVQLPDLRAALDSMLADKRAGGGGGAVGSAPVQWPQQLPMAFDSATARAPPPPPPTVHVATAPPPPAVTADEQAAAPPPPEAAPATGGGDFGGLSSAFLTAMQDALETLGHDLSSMAAVQSLAADPSLPAQLAPLLASAAPGVTNPAVLQEMVRQWQAMLAQRMEEEREAARKKQRPVWRCAVCGRYGCPVAPYIERYEEA